MKHELNYKQKVYARLMIDRYARNDIMGSVHKDEPYLKKHFSSEYRSLLNKMKDPFDIYYYLFLDKKYYECFFMITTIYSDAQNVKLSLLILSFLRDIVRQFNSGFYLSDVFSDDEKRSIDTLFKLFYFFSRSPDSSPQSLMREAREKIHKYYNYYNTDEHVSPYHEFKKKFYGTIRDISSAFGNYRNHKSIDSCKLSAFFSVENFVSFLSDFTDQDELQKIRDDIFSFSQIIMFDDNINICECNLNGNYRNSKLVRDLLEIDFLGNHPKW